MTKSLIRVSNLTLSLKRVETCLDSEDCRYLVYNRTLIVEHSSTTRASVSPSEACTEVNPYWQSACEFGLMLEGIFWLQILVHSCKHRPARVHRWDRFFLTHCCTIYSHSNQVEFLRFYIISTHARKRTSKILPPRAVQFSHLLSPGTHTSSECVSGGLCRRLKQATSGWHHQLELVQKGLTLAVYVWLLLTF